MKIIPFNFKTGEVKALQDEQGEPWFVAKDICDRLGIKNSRDAVSLHKRETIAYHDKAVEVVVSTTNVKLLLTLATSSAV